MVRFLNQLEVSGAVLSDKLNSKADARHAGTNDEDVNIMGRSEMCYTRKASGKINGYATESRVL